MAKASSDYQMFTQDGSNFFEVSSAFQKCVRRGMEHEALYYGTELFISGYDEYAWYRMRVMASEDVGLGDSMASIHIELLYQRYMDFKKKKNKHTPEKLPFIHALLVLIRSKKSRLVDNKLCYYFFLRHRVPKPKFPDFVYDMHTYQGKKLGRGNDHFYEESAKINNENLDEVPDEYQFRDFVWQEYTNEDHEKKNK